MWERKSIIFFVLAIVGVISFCSWGITRIVKSYQFDYGCKAYIQRAADASNVESAKEELGKAIKYCEDHNLTEGIVSIFLKNPKNDVGFWYKNMKNAYAELDDLAENATALEESNLLMRVRESITDNIPDGISIYPNNIAYFWWAIVSVVVIIGFGLLTFFYWDF